MFSFLRKFFKQEQPAQKVMALQELEAWIAGKEEKLGSAIKKILREADAEIAGAREKLQESINSLKGAELQNPNIPAKALHFMQGNRESYAKLASLFIRDALPEQITGMGYKGVKSFIAEFRQQIELFLSSSLKNYQVLQHFFAHESRAVAQRVREMEDAVRGIEKEIAASGSDALAGMKEEAAAISQKLRSRRELQEQIGRENEQLSGAAGKKQGLERELAAVESGEEAKMLAHWRQELSRHKDAMAQAEREFSLRFSPLEKALRKFAKISFGHGGLIALYAGSPERAIQEDGDLAILAVLPKLEQELLSGTLGLDEKRTRKALDALKGMSLEFFNGYLTRISSLGEKRKELERRIGESPVEKRKHALGNDLEKAETECTLARQRLALAEEQLKGVSIQKNKEAIESLAMASFSEGIILAVDENGKEPERL